MAADLKFNRGCTIDHIEVAVHGENRVLGLMFGPEVKETLTESIPPESGRLKCCTGRQVCFELSEPESLLLQHLKDSIRHDWT
jgi:hypothetical protein